VAAYAAGGVEPFEGARQPDHPLLHEIGELEALDPEERASDTAIGRKRSISCSRARWSPDFAARTSSAQRSRHPLG
jgi:hypothetical protein